MSDHEVEIGTVELIVNDVCLGGSEPSHSLITISGEIKFLSNLLLDITALKIHVGDLLKLGSSIDLEVEAFDSTGTIFRPDQYQYMQVAIHIDDDVVKVEPLPNSHRVYIVYGKQVGIGRITLSTTNQRGEIIYSQPVEISVFPEFKLLLRNVYLLPSATFQLQWTGGPPVRAQYSFKSLDTTIATIDMSGLVKANNRGKTQIEATVEVFIPSQQKN